MGDKIIMNIFNYFIKIFGNIYYFFVKFKKINKNKIVFISRLDDNKTLDFNMLEAEINKYINNAKCFFLCKRIEKYSDDFIGNIIFTIKCLNHLANAKVCITDSFTISVSTVKHKKELKIIQIWHSMGAIKKFGWQSVGKESGRDLNTAKILKMHNNYDYIISGSKNMTNYFRRAFNQPKEKFLNYGLPRIDYLINNKNKLPQKIYKDYPNLKNKINVLYVPTFRKTKTDNTIKLINAFDFKDKNLIVKSHANQELKVNNKVLTCDKYKAIDLLTIADYVITDYSGIAIEAAAINKKILFYLYDYNEYNKSNGINLNFFKEFPNLSFKSENELLKIINDDKYDIEELYKYKNKYIEVQDATSTKKICDLVKRCIEV